MFKRVLLAVAVAAAVSAPAFAEVTISGEMDVKLDYKSVDNADADVFGQNFEAYLSFDGSDKWDNGLTGGWHYALTTEDGTGVDAHSYWGSISGDFGQLRFGKMLTPAFQQIDWFTSHSGNFIGEQMFTYNNSAFDYNSAAGRRAENQIRYDGSFGPVSLGVATILNEREGDAGSMGYSVAGSVDLKPVTLYAAYENHQDEKVGALEGGIEFATAGIVGSFGDFYAGATYLWLNAEVNGGAFSNAAAEQDAWWVHGGYTFGKSRVSGFYGEAGAFDREQNPGSAVIPGFGAGAYTEYGVMFQHSLSKNTRFRTRVLRLDGNEKDANWVGEQTRVRVNLLMGF